MLEGAVALGDPEADLVICLFGVQTQQRRSLENARKNITAAAAALGALEDEQEAVDEADRTRIGAVSCDCVSTWDDNNGYPVYHHGDLKKKVRAAEGDEGQKEELDYWTLGSDALAEEVARLLQKCVAGAHSAAEAVAGRTVYIVADEGLFQFRDHVEELVGLISRGRVNSAQAPEGKRARVVLVPQCLAQSLGIGAAMHGDRVSWRTFEPRGREASIIVRPHARSVAVSLLTSAGRCSKFGVFERPLPAAASSDALLEATADAVAALVSAALADSTDSRDRGEAEKMIREAFACVFPVTEEPEDPDGNVFSGLPLVLERLLLESFPGSSSKGERERVAMHPCYGNHLFEYYSDGGRLGAASIAQAAHARMQYHPGENHQRLSRFFEVQFADLDKDVDDATIAATQFFEGEIAGGVFIKPARP